MVQTRGQQAANGNPLEPYRDPVEPIQIGPNCVEVHVGIEPYIKRYKYKKQVVTSQSDYFRGALGTYVVGNAVAQFADAASKIAKLPDVDSNIYKHVDWWLRKKEVKEQFENADISDVYDCKGNIDVVTYIEIYKLALFLGIKTLQNYIMWKFWDAWPPHSYTKYTYDLLPIIPHVIDSGTPELERFFIDLFVLGVATFDMSLSYEEIGEYIKPHRVDETFFYKVYVNREHLLRNRRFIEFSMAMGPDVADRHEYLSHTLDQYLLPKIQVCDGRNGIPLWNGSCRLKDAR